MNQPLKAQEINLLTNKSFVYVTSSVFDFKPHQTSYVCGCLFGELCSLRCFLPCRWYCSHCPTVRSTPTPSHYQCAWSWCSRLEKVYCCHLWSKRSQHLAWPQLDTHTSVVCPTRSKTNPARWMEGLRCQWGKKDWRMFEERVQLNKHANSAVSLQLNIWEFKFREEKWK